ncbi:putative terminase, large subunit [Edwardsiella phage MSW-3]|uniref:Putative terminase, large subunit n=1 Tax=Edwardsiella phage MSW-3 TaxID=1264700 RepID=L0MXE3_9CAUD|nr:terminase large subunit [Edwardsiella phage MSW-3]BAM68823.1 putative terminase, large subunit [Edwardsiella phage MSW-3]
MATLNPALRDFWRTRTVGDTAVRFRTLYGGRMSSKSHDAAGVAIARANHHPERFLCLRMYQNRIADSVYALLKDKIDYFGLSGNFKVYADAIEHKTNGSLFRFYGMARNIDEIKSFEGATVAWVEEAHNLTEEMFKVIRPTIMRNDGAEMWFTFNPRLATDFVYRRMVTNPPSGTLVRKINYDENPFLSATALADIESARDEDVEEFNHVYLGVPYDSDDNVVIRRAWIQSAIDAHLSVTPAGGSWFGGKCVGYDVADDGVDKNATTSMDGAVCVGLDEWKGNQDELRESAARVKLTAERLDASMIGYDSIGVGAGTGSHLNSLGWKSHFKFNAGGKVDHPDRMYGTTRIKNSDFFANLKAQAWWHVADRFRNTHLAVTKGRRFRADEMISLSSERIDPKLLDKLTDELATPMRDFDNAGRVKVESKKDLAKRDVVSPNIADSFIIANSRGLLGDVPIKEWL